VTDQQACAHLRVLYMTEQTEGDRTRGWWACDLCHREFIPVASAESAWGDPCRVCMQTRGRHWTVPHVAQSHVVARQRAEQELREAVGDYLAPHESRTHPGSGGDPDAAQRLQRVRDAYVEALRREPVPASDTTMRQAGYEQTSLLQKEPEP
jgi:hypothetical protein